MDAFRQLLHRHPGFALVLYSAPAGGEGRSISLFERDLFVDRRPVRRIAFQAE
jgi:hypothetical protein